MSYTKERLANIVLGNYFYHNENHNQVISELLYKPVTIHSSWLWLGRSYFQLFNKMRSSCSLLLCPYICSISKLHQALVLRFLLYILAANTTTVSRTRNLCFVAFTVVFETARPLAIASWSKQTLATGSKIDLTIPLICLLLSPCVNK